MSRPVTILSREQQLELLRESLAELRKLIAQQQALQARRVVFYLRLVQKSLQQQLESMEAEQ